jgi:hypothetical protein
MEIRTLQGNEPDVDLVALIGRRTQQLWNRVATERSLEVEDPPMANYPLEFCDSPLPCLDVRLSERRNYAGRE